MGGVVFIVMYSAVSKKFGYLLEMEGQPLQRQGYIRTVCFMGLRVALRIISHIEYHKLRPSFSDVVSS